MLLKTWPKADRSSRIVVIGRDLDQPDLQRCFDMLRAGQPDGHNDGPSPAVTTRLPSSRGLNGVIT